jgi:hypothetical protein
MESFDIFYVMYPNKWFKESGNFTANAEAVGNHDKDAAFQTGWVDFSLPTKTANACYSLDSKKMADNTGLGQDEGLFSFADRAYPLPDTVEQGPERAWIYNLSGEALSGTLRLTSSNDGNQVVANTYRGDSFTFNSSGSVLIGGSRDVESASVNCGFRGGIAAMVIFNRKLTGAENRQVLGTLFNKYLRTNAANSPSDTASAYQNRPSDLTGLAGQIYLT